jgi:UDP-glucose 4,6-dehydratase
MGMHGVSPLCFFPAQEVAFFQQRFAVIMTDRTYTPKNILVTGGAGFIASHVCILLATKYPQYKIVNYDMLDYCASLKNLTSIEGLPNYKFVKGNILSADLVNYVLGTEQIDTILHFAAQSHVDNSFGNSFPFTKTNILGTHILLESAKGHGIARFIHVSTDEVYGEGALNAAQMVEETTLAPSNPYAASKAAAEFIVKSYALSFKLPVIITRGNNVYGPHQYPEKLVPKLINQIFRGQQLTIHGNGLNTRNYLHVKDVARAFDCILHRGTVSEIYNIGGTNEVANLDVAKKLLSLMGHDSTEQQEKMLQFVRDRNFNDLRYTIDSTKLRGLGWTEQVRWEDGLRETIAWYRDNSGNWGDISSSLVAHPRRGQFTTDDE